MRGVVHPRPPVQCDSLRRLDKGDLPEDLAAPFLPTTTLSPGFLIQCTFCTCHFFIYNRYRKNYSADAQPPRPDSDRKPAPRERLIPMFAPFCPFECIQNRVCCAVGVMPS